MNPSELQVRDPIKKRHKINRAIRAFNAYIQRQKQTQNDLDLPIVDHQKLPGDLFDGGGTVLTSPTTIFPRNDTPQSKSTPNTSTVPHLSHVATPADSIVEMQTPGFDNRLAISLDKSECIPANTSIPDNERKRPAPYDLDPNIPSPPPKTVNIKFPSLYKARRKLPSSK
jgi:hypothetical protein